MDRLEEIWERQLEFTRRFIDPDSATEEEKLRYTKDILLHIVAEIDELLSAAGPWKTWVSRSGVLRRSGILEECVDIFKFLLNIPQVYGFTADDFYREFIRKSEVVEQKYWQDLALKNIKPTDLIAGVDIDGVLAAHPEAWIAFLNKELGTNWTIEDVEDIEYMFPEIPRAKYEELKFKYREEGYNRYVPLLPHAKEFLDALREAGFKIILLSRRPYKRHKRIFADTLEWLKKHQLPFDAIIWSEKKHEVLMKEFPQTRFMVEDEPRIAEEIGSRGFKCYVPVRPYNRDYEFNSPNVIMVQDLLEILDKEGIGGEKKWS